MSEYIANQQASASGDNRVVCLHSLRQDPPGAVRIQPNQPTSLGTARPVSVPVIAPFLAEMAELAECFRMDESFMNRDFEPPTNAFNLVLNDGGCRLNVTAEKTICSISIQTMPSDRSDDVIDMVTDRAEKYGLDDIPDKETSSEIATPEATIAAQSEDQTPLGVGRAPSQFHPVSRSRSGSRWPVPQTSNQKMGCRGSSFDWHRTNPLDSDKT